MDGLHFFHDGFKLFGIQGLGPVTQGFFRVVMDLNHQPVSARGDTGGTVS